MKLGKKIERISWYRLGKQLLRIDFSSIALSGELNSVDELLCNNIWDNVNNKTFFTTRIETFNKFDKGWF